MQTIRWGIIGCGDVTADALLYDPAVDAVYIATHPDSHADYTLRVAQAGKPVYVEKPRARTASACQAIVATLQGHGECPSTGESALRANRVLEQILRG